MNDAAVIAEILGGVALLLWATRMVRRAIERAASTRIRSLIRKSLRNRVRACAVGGGTALALQSSSATGLLVASFAERGLLTLAPALAMMLGADVGSSLAVQILALKSDFFASLLLATGVIVATAASDFAKRQIGRAIIGVALILFSLDLISDAISPLRDAPPFVVFVDAMTAAPVAAFMAGALVAWGSHSSVAVVLLVASLAGTRVIPIELGLALILGANAGSGLIPLAAGARMGEEAKRVLIGNLGFRVAGALVALALLSVIAAELTALGAAPGLVIIFAHIGFNLCLALAFLPFIGAAARLLKNQIKSPPAREITPASRLKTAPIERPELAIATVDQQILRLADLVELMLNEVLTILKAEDRAGPIRIGKLEKDVDALQSELKQLLAKLMCASKSEDMTRKCFDALLFATNLEHAADIVDNGLLKLAAKRQRLGAVFSDAGLQEIEALHGRAIAHLRLAVSVYSTADLGLAKELVAEKDKFRTRERQTVANHVERLQAGMTASIETSDIHLDVVRDLKHIIAHLTAVAHPILESHGALRGTRLIAE